MKNNNVEKELPAKGDLSEREELIKLASETAAEEKDLSDFYGHEVSNGPREIFRKQSR